jgi:hypothetical protein
MEAVRAGEKILLVHCLQRHRDRPLKHLVLEGGNPQRTRPATPFRDVHTAHGRRAVRPGLRSVEQRLEVLLQVLRVLLRALPVDADGSVLRVRRYASRRQSTSM